MATYSETIVEMNKESTVLLEFRAKVMFSTKETEDWFFSEKDDNLSSIKLMKEQFTSTASKTLQSKFYVIGRQSSRQLEILRYEIDAALAYTEIEPTFHLWQSGDVKIGLVFESHEDAREFSAAVRSAVEELANMDRVHAGSAEDTIEEQLDDDIFVEVDLPAIKENSIWYRQSEVFFVKHEGKLNPSHDEKTSINVLAHNKGEDNSLVIDDKASKKVQENLEKKIQKNVICVKCNEIFDPQNNNHGDCKVSDKARKCIKFASCMNYAECMSYHCFADSEGDFEQVPCSCERVEGCTNRWFGLTVLSIFSPCLCFYPPLALCYYGLAKCGVCGKRHVENIN